LRRGASFFAFFPFNAKVPANLNINYFPVTIKTIDKDGQKLYNGNKNKDTTPTSGRRNRKKERKVQYERINHHHE